MKYKSASDFRDVEVRLLYDTIFRKYRKEHNCSFREAREAAYDAVCLRFTLSRTRVRIIVNQQANADISTKLPMLIAQNETMLEHLAISNEQMGKEIEKNKKLIDLLQYANETYKRYR